jgi:hypothetical protein
VEVETERVERDTLQFDPTNALVRDLLALDRTRLHKPRTAEERAKCAEQVEAYCTERRREAIVCVSAGKEKVSDEFSWDYDKDGKRLTAKERDK